MNQRKYTFGEVREPAKDVAESRIIDYVLSTFKRDRHGTVVNQDNWKLDNYRKNPVVAYQHQTSGGLFTEPNPDNIIGKDVNPRVEGYEKEKKLCGSVQFEPSSINPLAEKIYRKALFGSLPSASVGFIEIGIGHYGKGDEALRGANETYYYDGQELIEWSIVNVPSNPDANKRTARSLPSGAFDYARKMLGKDFNKSQIEQMTIEDLMILCDGRDMGVKDRNPDKVKKILQDWRIERERLEFRRAYDARIERERKEFRERHGIQIEKNNNN